MTSDDINFSTKLNRVSMCFFRRLAPVEDSMAMQLLLSSFIITGFTTSSLTSCICIIIHTSSWLASERVTYSTSVEDKLTHCCFLAAQLGYVPGVGFAVNLVIGPVGMDDTFKITRSELLLQKSHRSNEPQGSLCFDSIGFRGLALTLRLSMAAAIAISGSMGIFDGFASTILRMYADWFQKKLPSPLECIGTCYRLLGSLAWKFSTGSDPLVFIIVLTCYVQIIDIQ